MVLLQLLIATLLALGACSTTDLREIDSDEAFTPAGAWSFQARITPETLRTPFVTVVASSVESVSEGEWPRLSVRFDPTDPGTESKASIDYPPYYGNCDDGRAKLAIYNPETAAMDEYCRNSTDTLTDMRYDAESRVVEGQMELVGARIKGEGTFSEDFATLQLALAFDVEQLAGTVWTPLAEATLARVIDPWADPFDTDTDDDSPTDCGPPGSPRRDPRCPP